MAQDGSRRCPPAYEPHQTGKLAGRLTFSIKEPGYYGSAEIKEWSETNKLPLQELLAQLVGAIREHFLDVHIVSCKLGGGISAGAMQRCAA